MREIAVFGGMAHPAQAAEICSDLGVPQRPVRFTRFANDCLEVQLQSKCRDRDVFLIQPLVPPVRENLVELLLMADAARGASAARLTAVMPHYAYARSDKKDEPRMLRGRPARPRSARGTALAGQPRSADAVSFAGVRLRSRKRPGLDKLARGRLIGGTGAE